MRRMLALALAALAVAACGSTAAGGSSSRGGFAGYKWSVVAISHDGTETPVAAHYNVYLQFAPNGQYGANDPVNYHFGTYRQTGDGFRTSRVAVTAVGYAGNDPVITLAMTAISRLDNLADVPATVTGNQLDVVAGGYTLTCQRAGEQGNLTSSATN
jgi:heat shock protein HslJ